MGSPLPTLCQIQLFDVHTCLPPVDRTELFREPFDKILPYSLVYSAKYAEQTPFPATDHFSVRPLNTQEIESNHFWRHLPDGDAWKVHKPLLAVPHLWKAELAAEDFGVQAPIDAEVFLWPWGWSTNLTATLSGQIPFETLREIIGGLGKSNPRRVLRLDGQLVKPSALFGKMRELLFADFYALNAISGEQAAIQRHFLLSIFSVEGDAYPYSLLPSAGLPRLDVSTRAALHSVILGRPVSLEELDQRETPPRDFLLTENFSGTAFALSDWSQNGSVLFLPGLRRFDTRRSNQTEHCLSTNVKNCAALASGLSAVVSQPLFDEPGPRLSALISSARRLLRLMRNQFQESNRHLYGGYFQTPLVGKGLNALDKESAKPQNPA
jgi:hypothetical protein